MTSLADNIINELEMYLTLIRKKDKKPHRARAYKSAIATLKTYGGGFEKGKSLKFLGIAHCIDDKIQTILKDGQLQESDVPCEYRDNYYESMEELMINTKTNYRLPYRSGEIIKSSLETDYEDRYEAKENAICEFIRSFCDEGVYLDDDVELLGSWGDSYGPDDLYSFVKDFLQGDLSKCYHDVRNYTPQRCVDDSIFHADE